MTNKLPKYLLLVVVLGTCLFYVSSAYPQKPMEKPITKDGLFKTLETKLTNSGFEHLIKRIQERGVSFMLDDADKKKLLSLQRSLSQKKLNKLLDAVRGNYRPFMRQGAESMADEKKPDATPTSINQTMNNSPHGVQSVGDNVTINQGALPRVLTATQRSEIVKALQGHKPAKVHVLIVGGEREIRAYAEQIAEAINSAGWEAETVNYALMMAGAYGVQSRISDPNINQAIMSAFSNAKVEILPASVKNDFPNSILVAQKP